ncbi:MAG: UDP-glucose 4-epimerase GalE [Planctomycetota bacterium]
MPGNTVLVTGGAGYIGSHTVKLLRERGHDVVIYDDLRYGHRAAVADVPLVVGDLLDESRLKDLLRRYAIGACVHFAARCYVGESVENPLKYYRDNVAGSIALINQLVAAGVRRVVFSSSCAVYGAPDRIPILEDTPRRPVNPYGRSKRIIEDVLADCESAHGLASASLRYFNAAGADPDGQLGEWHDPETHLIPLALRAAMNQGTLKIFGDRYPTADGTCVRDYIHVTDLAEAHLAALARIASGTGRLVLNLGTGQGYSVKQVIAAASRVSGRQIKTEIAPPRAGDPPELVAGGSRARDVLGWQPRYPDLETIVQHAWNWLSKHPHGYGS